MLASASTMSPAAVTSVKPTMLSDVTPWRRSTTPMPPPRARPAIPTVGHEPAGMDTPFGANPE